MFMYEMTFDNFCYDDHDNGRVVEELKKFWTNPLRTKVLCLWGSNSSGKTHLLHAIQNENEKFRIVFMTADRFNLMLAYTVESGDVQKFEESFEEVDILLLDDAQFLVGKYALEFLKERIIPRIRCNVLLASDCDPYTTGILGKDEIALKLATPNNNVRYQIVRRMSDIMQLQIDNATQHLIAKNISDVRRIHGFLTFLKAASEKKSVCP